MLSVLFISSSLKKLDGIHVQAWCDLSVCCGVVRCDMLSCVPIVRNCCVAACHVLDCYANPWKCFYSSLFNHVLQWPHRAWTATTAKICLMISFLTFKRPLMSMFFHLYPSLARLHDATSSSCQFSDDDNKDRRNDNHINNNDNNDKKMMIIMMIKIVIIIVIIGIITTPTYRFSARLADLTPKLSHSVLQKYAVSVSDRFSETVQRFQDQAMKVRISTLLVEG